MHIFYLHHSNTDTDFPSDLLKIFQNKYGEIFQPAERYVNNGETYFNGDIQVNSTGIWDMEVPLVS